MLLEEEMNAYGDAEEAANELRNYCNAGGEGKKLKHLYNADIPAAEAEDSFAL